MNRMRDEQEGGWTESDRGKIQQSRSPLEGDNLNGRLVGFKELSQPFDLERRGQQQKECADSPRAENGSHHATVSHLPEDGQQLLCHLRAILCAPPAQSPFAVPTSSRSMGVRNTSHNDIRRHRLRRVRTRTTRAPTNPAQRWPRTLPDTGGRQLGRRC